MSGPEMLMQAALKAFVPKETAEKVQAAIEGMLRDGTLDGIGSLVSDIAEIKRNQKEIMFGLGLGRIFAGLSLEQQIHANRAADRVPGSPGTGPCDLVARNDGPRLIAGSGNGSDAGGEPDGICSGDAAAPGSNRSEAAE